MGAGMLARCLGLQLSRWGANGLTGYGQPSAARPWDAPDWPRWLWLRGSVATPFSPPPPSPLRWKAVLDAAVDQSRARITNDGRGPAIGRGSVGSRRATAPLRQQADPGDSDSSMPPPPLSPAVPGGGVDAAALHALMQQMAVGVSSLNARLGAIENRMDSRATPTGQQEQGSGVGGCCAVSASGSDAGKPPARAPSEV